LPPAKSPTRSFGQIGQDADWTTGLDLQRANDGEPLGVIVVGSMAKIEAKDVGASLEKRADNIRRIARRTQGGDNFSLTLTAH
jgi:hypothetical protein